MGINGKKGIEVRRHFIESPYGWPQDAVDGALLALLAGGFLKATHNGQNATAIGMTRQQIGVTDFAEEGVTISAIQRIEVRRLATALELPIQNGEEVEAVPSILMHIGEQAHAVGGEPPLPKPPDQTLVTDLQGISGNKQVTDVAKRVDELIKYYRDCSEAADTAIERLPSWKILETFVRHARDLNGHPN